MAALRLYVTERDGTILGPLPSARLGTINLELSGTDSTTISADPDNLGPLKIADAEIQAWVQGEDRPRLVGVPFTATRSVDGRRVSIPVLGLEAYLARWYVDEDLDYVDVDQHNIAAQILAWAQSRAIPGADANIDAASFALSGVTRTRSYNGDELPNVLEILQSFQTLEDGFDWSIEPVGGDRREWTPHYPRRGVDRTSWHLHYREHRAGNVAAIGYHLDGSQITRRHHATSMSDGDGPGKLVGTYLDPTLDGLDGRALLESASSESTSISDAATLISHARARVEARSAVARTWEAYVTDPTIAMGIELGDRLEVDLADGWQAYTGAARIVKINLDAIAERATLTLTEEPA